MFVLVETEGTNTSNINDWCYLSFSDLYKNWKTFQILICGSFFKKSNSDLFFGVPLTSMQRQCLNCAADSS